MVKSRSPSPEDCGSGSISSAVLGSRESSPDSQPTETSLDSGRLKKSVRFAEDVEGPSVPLGHFYAKDEYNRLPFIHFCCGWRAHEGHASDCRHNAYKDQDFWRKRALHEEKSRYGRWDASDPWQAECYPVPCIQPGQPAPQYHNEGCYLNGLIIHQCDSDDSDFDRDCF